MKIERKKKVVESSVMIDATGNRIVRLVVQRGDTEIVVPLTPKEARKLANGLREKAVIANHLADEPEDFDPF
ncbi:hypothetical protein [Leucobacter aridicollis]|uniref:hypothetical protein n=1 Tax=Leucobacter aridicollis TaxID=283878 RepID=UPI002167E364|nr:hypothetical protein [Leucobacter aridicollis]MCS3426702.1 1,2-phenylacetyl-CoA epoxidase catalytic subunit [Leucobacter aridicollis]